MAVHRLTTYRSSFYGGEGPLDQALMYELFKSEVRSSPDEATFYPYGLTHARWSSRVDHGSPIQWSTEW